MTQKKIFEIGGYIAAAILIAFGLGSIGMSINGRNEVRADVKREYIVGSQDMNKTAILAEAKQANLPAEVMDQIPTCNVAGKTINSGARAKCFAAYMRIHTFESTGGKTYSQMGRYLTKSGKDTNDPTLAASRSEDAAADRERRPEPLGDGDRPDQRAEHLVLRGAGRMFGIVVGFAFLLAGIGFAILAFMAFRWLPAREAKAAKPHRPGFRSPSESSASASHGGPALPALRVFPRRWSGGAPM